MSWEGTAAEGWEVVENVWQELEDCWLLVGFAMLRPSTFAQLLLAATTHQRPGLTPPPSGSAYFYLPYGLGIAVNTRVSNELGANRWASARSATKVSLLLGLAVVCCTWLGVKVVGVGLEDVRIPTPQQEKRRTG